VEDLITLQEILLVPVITLEPSKFSRVTHQTDADVSKEMPQDQEQSWYSALADSGLNGLIPVVRGSWNVPVSQFADSQLETILRRIVEDWGGVSYLNNPDTEPFLSGGFVLLSANQGLVIEPTCCGDLRDISNWKEAATSSGSEWEQLWIGHPWLSYKYQEPWLLLSDLHEAKAPVERWVVRRKELEDAVLTAESELVAFADRIDVVLSMWPEIKNSKKAARMMAGLV
jgi:hypothetical protein